ncbi:MAG: hypothetical protein U9P50_03420 [Patescibacteria group bacterium]|nr:hypothetical protein [Patescibacteria group bacterium]
MTNKNIAILIIIILLAVIGFKFFGGESKGISPKEAQTRVQELIDMNPDNLAVIKSVVEEGGVYKITVVLGEQEFYSYLSKDGSKFFPEAIDLGELNDLQKEAPKQEVSAKSNKPVVELFVMSHCPYGTQIEKGILPVLETLGDKIDFELKFCDYAIHDKIELNEQTQQYCIGEQSKDKLLSYLKCFLEDGNSSRCLSQSEINNSTLQTCISNTNTKYNTLVDYEDKSTWTKMNPPSPIFNIHKEDNLKYKVEGSPELVINEEKILTYRDPQSLLTAICSAFKNAPEECSQTLSSEAFAPGFGFSNTGESSTDATCN